MLLEGKFQRGFSTERLASIAEPKVRQDDRGYYIMSLSENSQVYFEDFYAFMEQTYNKALACRLEAHNKLAELKPEYVETIAYYRARTVIIDLLLTNIRRFYTDGANFGVVMTPWCFGTVMLEKIEVYRERLGKGEVQDPNIPDYPYYVIRYLDEIYRSVLLELFDFPDSAFQMRWQYSELLKKYSGILNNITDSLQSVLLSIKNYGSR